jgi:hypothetical protein
MSDEIDHLRQLIANARQACSESYEFDEANSYTFEALNRVGLVLTEFDRLWPDAAKQPPALRRRRSA